MTPPALEDLDLTAALAAFRDQEEKHGHTAAADAERSLYHFGSELVTRGQELRDVIAFPGERLNLEVGYRRAARLAALALATMRRIRLEQERRR